MQRERNTDKIKTVVEQQRTLSVSERQVAELQAKEQESFCQLEAARTEREQVECSPPLRANKSIIYLLNFIYCVFINHIVFIYY